MISDELYLCEAYLEINGLDDDEIHGAIFSFFDHHPNTLPKDIASQFIDLASSYLLSLIEDGQYIEMNEGYNASPDTISDIKMTIHGHSFLNVIPSETLSSKEKDVISECENNCVSLSLDTMKSMAERDLFDASLVMAINELGNFIITLSHKQGSDLTLDPETALERFLSENFSKAKDLSLIHI